MVEQRPAEPAAGVPEVDGDLIDLQAAVEHLGHEVGDRLIGVVGYHPQLARLLAGRHDRQRPRVVLRDLGHADVREHLPGRPLYLLQAGKFFRPGHPDKHGIIVAGPVVR